MNARPAGLVLGLCLACASAQSTPVATTASTPVSDGPALVRVHLDTAAPGAVEIVAGTRAEYRGWVMRYATPPGETPVSFLRVGVSGLWAMRAAGSWDEIPGQVRRDGEVESRVRAAVGKALDANGERMHGNILEHHNELLRFQPEPSRGKGALAEVLGGVHTVVLDFVVPGAGDAYAAQSQARSGGNAPGWHWVFVSSPGSGATVHLLGEGAVLAELPDAVLVRERRVLDARVDLTLGTTAP